MDKRFLHGLDRDVSALGAGCWTIGGLATNRGTPIGWAGVTEDSALDGLGRAYDRGVTFFDTADVYGMGRSERLVGRLLAQIDRSRVTVSSKVGYFAGTSEHPYCASQILRQFETTCENLGTEYLDVYFLHSADFGPDDHYLPEAVETLQAIKQDGRVRAIGMKAPHEFAVEWASTPRHPQLAASARFLGLFGLVRPDVLIVRHNLLSPTYGPQETDIFALARQSGTGVLIKQALGQGLLIGAHDPEQPRTFHTADHRHGDPRFGKHALHAIHAGLSDLGDRFGASLRDRIRVALQYALSADPNAPVLIGFRDAEQITVNLDSVGEPLTDEDVGAIRAVMAPVRAMLFPDTMPNRTAVETTA